jgi:DNA repair protein RadA/Sms
MTKKTAATEFECSQCGRREPKWMGRCPECGEWNSLKEVPAKNAGGKAGASSAPLARPLPLAAVNPDDGTRIPSGLREFDRVLGGGIMRGSAVLIGGEPGIGKSTFLLQVLCGAETKGRLLYISGEESAGQIKLRAERLGLKREGLELFCHAELPEALAALDSIKPTLIVVDSVQTLHADDAGAVAGTVNQMKYCAMELVDWAKTRGAVIFLVAHVTKEGVIAGPKALEHLVDTVLYFEQSDSDVRFLRSAKNRFGATDELGLFLMTEKGLREVADPSELFLVRRSGGLPEGVAVAPIYEGSRVILVEIQALTVPSKTGLSRVYSDKVDSQRVARVAAVLEKQTGLRFSDQDVYVNVAGGMRIGEVGVELALACALYSARTNRPLPEHCAIAGELSLAGEVRPVRFVERRHRAAQQAGFTRLIAPRRVRGDGDGGWEETESLKSALALLFGFRPESPAGKA